MSISVIHVTSAHPSDDVRIFRKMAYSQTQRGWRVCIVAAASELARNAPSRIGGVTVHTIVHPNIAKRGYRASVGALKVMWVAARMRPDLVQAHDPELIPFLIPLRFMGIKTIFDAHEDFVAQNDHKVWTGGRIQKSCIRFYSRLLRTLAARFCWMILAATDGVASPYPRRKTLVVRNYPINGELGFVQPERIAQRPHSIAYIGAISEVRGIIQTLEAIDQCDALDCLELAGRFETPEIEQKVRAMPGWRKVKYHGFVDRGAIAEILGRVRGGLVTLLPTPNHLHAIPIKLMEYFNAGLPAVVSDFTYWRTLVTDQETGILVDPFDVQQIAVAIDRLMDNDVVTHMASKVAAGPKETYSWDAEAERMNSTIERKLRDAS